MKIKKTQKIISSILIFTFVMFNLMSMGNLVKVNAQTITVLSEGFDGTTVTTNSFTPSTTSSAVNWTYTTGSGIAIGGYATPTNFGTAAPSVKFQSTGNQITSPTFNLTENAELSFWIKAQASNGVDTSKVLVEGYDGTNWNIVQDIQLANNTLGVQSYPLDKTTKQIRFSFTKLVGNVAIDDILITQEVVQANVNVTGVTLSKSTLSLKVGETAALTASVQPDTATDKAISWSSDNTTVAAVDINTGNITANAVGSANISVTTHNGGKTAACVVTVVDNTPPANVPTTGVSIDKPTLSLNIGQSSLLLATVQPDNATNKTVSWSSDNTPVATVNQSTGMVTAVSAGTANVTVTTQDGNKTSLCVVTVNPNAPPVNKTFDIVEITDFHGQLLDTTMLIPVGAGLAYLVKGVKAANPERTLIIGGGDLYQGTPISNSLHGVPVKDYMNSVGMEVTALGNHEFDWGLDTINNETMNGANYSIVCSNMYVKSTNSRKYEPYKIITKDGIRIAVIGAILKDAPTIITPALVADYDFRDPATEINTCAKEIRDGKLADIVLAVIHDGGSSLNSIVKNLSGVDAVFGGHDHTNADTTNVDADGKVVPTLDASSTAKGYIDLKITVDGATKALSFSAKGTNWKAFNSSGSFLTDPDTKKIIDDAASPLISTFTEVIGNDPAAYTKDQTDSPYGECQLGNWMADVVRNDANADVGMVNNGGIRLSPIPAGNITVGTVFNLMPFDNTITTVTMTGAQLKKIFEQAVQDSGKGIQISGVKFIYDATKQSYKAAVLDASGNVTTPEIPGQRVLSITRESDGSIVKDTDVLKVAAPDFIATGGDTFTGFLDPSIVSTYVDSKHLVRDALTADVRAKHKITVVMNNRIDNQVAEVPPVVMTIAQARTTAIGTTVTLTGYVSAVNGKNVFMQDEANSPTAGICVYNSASAVIHKGDKITATGPLSVFNGLLEITPSSVSKVSILSSNNSIAPKTVTVSGATNLIQGQLIKLKSLTVDSIDNAGATMVHDSTGSINIFKMPVVSGLVVGDVIDVTGAVTCYGSTIELAVDSASDVVKNSGSTPAAATISIIGTSDLHGAIFPMDYNTGAASNVGLAKISTYVKSVRAANPNTMLIDAGDTIQGTPLVYYYNMIDQISEYPMMKVMGAMGYDTWTLGNHEFNYGLTTLNRIIADAKKNGIHVLSANIHKTADGSTYVDPYYIKSFTINGKTIKVGILGLTTKCVPNWEDPAHYAGLQFNDLVSEAKYWVPKVKEAGADIVIASIHSGISSPSDTIPENQVDLVAQQVSGIDAILCGHTHSAIPQRFFTNPDGKQVPVTETKNGDSIFSQIDISVDVNGNVTGIITKNVSLSTPAVIAADQSIIDIAQPYQNATLAYTNTVIGKSTGEYTGAGQITGPTAIMELINKVQANAAGAELSIAAPLSSSAHIPQGDIKRQDIMGVYVYENFLYGVKMTGKQLKNWLEWSARYYKQVSSPSDPITFALNADGKQLTPDYNLDQLYGATYDIDLTKPACTTDANGMVISGDRIKNLKVNGILVKDTDVFKVAINNYRYNGGGGFMVAAGLIPGSQAVIDATFYDSGKVLGDDGQVRNMMFKYVQDNGTITPTNSNNWKIYKTSLLSVYPSITTNKVALKDKEITVTLGTDANHPVNDLYGFDMTFKYDPALFTFEGAVLNNGFASDPTKGSLLYDTKNGAVRFLGTLLGVDSGVSGTNVGLVNVTLKVKNTAAPATDFTIVANSQSIFPNSTSTMFADKSGNTNTLVNDVTNTISIANDNAALNSITINGKLVADFTSENKTYNVVFPTTIGDQLDITCVASDNNSTYTISKPSSIPGAAIIVVTAQDGITQRTYTLNLSKKDVVSIIPASNIVEIDHESDKAPVHDASITLTAKGASNLKRYTLVFKYDPTLFKFKNILQSDVFTVEGIVDDGNGNITLTGTSSSGLSGDLNLATIILTTKNKEGLTPLTVVNGAIFTDANGVATSLGAEIKNSIAITNSVVTGSGTTPTIGDLTTVASVFGKQDSYNARYDMNKDGAIDIIDIVYEAKMILGVN